jgi:hypothetical protein
MPQGVRTKLTPRSRGVARHFLQEVEQHANFAPLPIQPRPSRWAGHAKDQVEGLERPLCEAAGAAGDLRAVPQTQILDPAE